MGGAQPSPRPKGGLEGALAEKSAHLEWLNTERPHRIRARSQAEHHLKAS